jgi:hypothetical protein
MLYYQHKDLEFVFYSPHRQDEERTLLSYSIHAICIRTRRRRPLRVTTQYLSLPAPIRFGLGQSQTLAGVSSARTEREQKSRVGGIQKKGRVSSVEIKKNPPSHPADNGKGRGRNGLKVCEAIGEEIETLRKIRIGCAQ